jgi:hypothetical protein
MWVLESSKSPAIIFRLLAKVEKKGFPENKLSKKRDSIFSRMIIIKAGLFHSTRRRSFSISFGLRQSV